MASLNSEESDSGTLRKRTTILKDHDDEVIKENQKPKGTKSLPELTFKNVMIDILQIPFKLALSPLSFGIIPIPLFIFESLAMKYIITNVPYTEIDYSTYMQQVSSFWQGERDYHNIEGDTGPLVYPGGHIWLYTAMQWLSGEESQTSNKSRPSIMQALAGSKFMGRDTQGSKEIIKEAIESKLESGSSDVLINGMQNILPVQHAFRWVFLLTLVFLVTGYWILHAKVPYKGSGFKFIDDEVLEEEKARNKGQTEKEKVQLRGFAPYLLVLLVASKRIQSIYVLRLFNDCFVTLFESISWVLILLAIRFKRNAAATKGTSAEDQSQLLSSAAYSLLSFVGVLVSSTFYALALSVKMNALLFFPGYVLLLYLLCSENAAKLAAVLAHLSLVFALVNWPFVFSGHDNRMHFLSRAFDFGRVFTYKWTVNWKFVPEEIFVSRSFHLALLCCHVLTLAWLMARRYLAPQAIQKTIFQFVITDGLKKPLSNTLSSSNIIISDLGEVYATYVLFTCNLTGILFARSLHYQFLTWYHWTLPFLLHISGLSWYIILPIAAIHEFSWCVYPSTALSSATLVSILALLLVMSIQNGLFGKNRRPALLARSTNDS